MSEYTFIPQSKLFFAKYYAFAKKYITKKPLLQVILLCSLF